MICGNGEGTADSLLPQQQLQSARFFRDADTDFAHDGSNIAQPGSRAVLERDPGPNTHPDAQTPPPDFLSGHRQSTDGPQVTPTDGDPDRAAALPELNTTLAREGFDAFYASDLHHAVLRHIGAGAIAAPSREPAPFRLQRTELVRRRASGTHLLDKGLRRSTADTRRAIAAFSPTSLSSASLPRVVRIERSDAAKIFGCATPCRRSMYCTSACRPNVTSLMPPA